MPRKPKPPGRWKSPTVLAEIENRERTQRLLLKGGYVRVVVPGTVLLVHVDGGPDLQWTTDGDRCKTEQVRLATVVGVEL
jgi:hypothetical protein